MQTAVVLYLTSGLSKAGQADVEHHRGGHAARGGGDLSAGDVLLLYTGEVYGDALAAVGLLDVMGVYLYASGAGHDAAGVKHDLVALVKGALYKGAGYDRAEAAEGKDPVGRKAEGA